VTTRDADLAGIVDGRWEWDRCASLPGLSPCVDYQPRETHWARYLDALHKRALEEVLTADPGARFLDFGCGVGRIAEWLAPRVGTVVAADPSAAMLDVARARSTRDNVTYVQLDALDAPYALDAPDAPAGSFDGATAVWVLQHIIDDGELAGAIERLARVLRPGGLLYTIDRLRQFRPDGGGDRLGYQRKRLRVSYELAFTRDSVFDVVTRHPILVAERALGSGWLTALVKGTGWWSRRLVERNLDWARRQVDPDEADYLWCLRRR
jgi:SAM-dependent methyltransferase